MTSTHSTYTRGLRSRKNRGFPWVKGAGISVSNPVSPTICLLDVPRQDEDEVIRHHGIVKQATTTLAVRTQRQGLIDITRLVEDWVATQSFDTGLLTLFCRHTSASLLIQKNAAPDVRTDIETYFARIAPESGNYLHDDEGPDDMPAHLRTALTQVQLSIPLIHGDLALGTWQGVYLFEHRRQPHRREIALHLIGM